MDFPGWPTVLKQLLDRADLGGDEAAAAVTTILEGEATSAQIAGFLVALRAKGPTVTEFAGMLGAMLAAATPLPLDPDVAAVDTCGTGGDGLHTINVSTIAALVVAGAGGRVCKHGNRAASSACGSADVLEALGVTIDAPPPVVARCVEEAGIGFCFAPTFHPAMRHVGPTRRELGVPTVFNLLGPCANPARVRRQVVGVSDPAHAELIARALAAHGSEHVLVVHGHDGIDELSTVGPSTVVTWHGGTLTRSVVDPESLGLRRATHEELRGGDAATNAAIARAVLGGAPGAHRDVVLLNAAAALVVAGLADDLAQGLSLGAAAIDDGRAAAALDRLVTVSGSDA